MYWLTVLGIAIPSIIAIVLGVPPLRAALADLRKKPRLRFTLNQSSERRIVYVADVEDDEFLVAEFQIEIENVGTASAHGVQIIVDAPANLYVTDGVTRGMSRIADLLNYEFAVERVANTQRTRAVYKIPVLHQKSRSVIVDCFSFHGDSIGHHSMQAKAKDDVSIDVKYSLRRTFVVKINAVADDHAPIGQYYEVEFYRPRHAELAYTRDAEGARNALFSHPKTIFTTAIPARIFRFERRDLLVELDRIRIWKTGLEGCTVQHATHFQGIGYLPFRSQNFSKKAGAENTSGRVYVRALGTFIEPTIDSIQPTDSD